MSEEILVAPLRMAEQPCPYLAGHSACYEHFLLVEGGEEGVSRLIEAGFRHFGHYYFRPACAGAPGSAWCGSCVPLRVNVAEFAPSKTQRRVLRRGASIVMEIGGPKYVSEKFEIYAKHRRRFPAIAVGQNENEESFRDSFYNTGPFVKECVYRLEGRLIAISFLDVTRRAVSSIYCAFDPEFEKWAPGTLSILREIEFARLIGAPFYYLGYWVNDNRSLKYKADYRPCEVFNGAAWVGFRDAAGRTLLNPAQLRTGRFGPLIQAPGTVNPPGV